jgi:hypothetical protein
MAEIKPATLLGIFWVVPFPHKNKGGFIMSRSGFMRGVLALFLGFAIGSAGAGDSNLWRKFDVPVGSTYRVTDANGVEREIAPSCSGGPVCSIDPNTGIRNCRKGNEQFSFFYKPGRDAKKLLVFFDGGGACWDSNTCVTGNLSPLSSYVPEITAESDPSAMGGVFNIARLDNPYRDWNMVVIPYCTGDIHWGSKDQTYVDYTGAVTGLPGGQVTIHHRGFDNFLYVRDWITKRFPNGDSLEKMLVTGSSAGAYGSAFAYPHLKQTFPRAKGYLFGDAGNGVMTDAFLDQAIEAQDSSWNIQGNLAHWVPGLDYLPHVPAAHFVEAYYFAVAGYYRQDRLAQYTTHWDTVQVLFYNIMLNQDNVLAWGDLTPEVYGSWVQQMLGHVFVTAINPNYRFYVAEGCNHTLLRHDDDFYGRSPNQPIRFLAWFRAMTQDGFAALPWQNSFCFNCSTPPTEAEAGACLARSFAQ